MKFIKNRLFPSDSPYFISFEERLSAIIKKPGLQAGLILGTTGLLLTPTSHAATNLNLAALNGANGFTINGLAAGDQFGLSVSDAGDMNGDGFGDVVIGAPGDGITDPGQAFVIFGKGGGFSPNFDLATLNGVNGFVINGVQMGDLAGYSVSSAGDFNGDGIGDIIIGAPTADPGAVLSRGQSYIIFGKSTAFTSPLNLAALAATDGFAINGINMSDQAGSAVSGVGRFNNDTFDDVIIGAPQFNGSDGRAYIVFGKAAGFATLDLATLPSVNGIVLPAIAGGGGQTGCSVSGAGNVNGDGFDDVIIGAKYADPNANANAGQSYIVFGKAGTMNVDLATLNGNNGFAVNGGVNIVVGSARSGGSVSGAGDINGDTLADVIIGARRGDLHGLQYGGQCYVVFGKSNAFTATLDATALNGTNGFRISSEAAMDYAGTSVSGAGDVNGDGLDDLIVGANGADPNGLGSGKSYVIFGKSSGFSANFSLSNINGLNGFTLNGIAAGNQSGGSVSRAGDVNKDNANDIIIGAYGGNGGTGQGYVVFGTPPPPPGGFSGDNQVDLLLQSKAQVSAALMSNGVYQGVTTNITTLTSPKEKIVGVNDFNLDGKSDIVTQRKLTVTILDGANLSNSLATLTLQRGHKVLATGNVAGSGNNLPDILTRKGSKVFAYEKNATGFASSPVGIYTNSGGFKVVAAGKFGSTNGSADLILKKGNLIQARPVGQLTAPGTSITLPTGYKKVIGAGDFVLGGNWEVITQKGKKIGIGTTADVFTIPKKTKVVGPK